MSMQLTTAQLKAFDNDGFLVVPSVIDDATLTAIRAGFARRVAGLLSRYARLGVGSGASGEFDADIQQLLSVAPQAYQHLDISLPMVHDLSACVPEWERVFGEQWQEQAGLCASEEVFNLIAHPNIVGIARQLVGGEVVASPVQHTRIKPPQHLIAAEAQIDANTARTLWHQDEAVVTEEARGVDILTVWVAITDATIKNGCMEAVVGSHRQPDSAAQPDFGLTSHCPGKGNLVGEIYIDDSQIDKTHTAPLVANAGDVVLLHKRTIHGAGANESDGVRWSFDLRYQPASAPSGRDFFPSCVVHSSAGKPLTTAKAYRQNWLQTRDEIIHGQRTAIFNTRWNKYATSPLCA